MSAENYVYKKEVDWSLFNYGLNIPIQHQVKFKQIAGRFIERGESKPITLYLNGRSYKARLYNLKIDAKYGNHADMVQIRYSGNSDIANALRGCFNRSYAHIKRIKDMWAKGSKNHVPLPDEIKEYLAIYTTEYDDSYILEPIVASDLEVYRSSIENQKERMVEASIDYDVTDPNAGFMLYDDSKASNWLRSKLLFTTCAVIKKYRHDYFREEWDMALEKEKKDRSYQYGRLLAVLEKAERDTYGADEDREPNAMRMQSVFTQRPQYAARMIWEQVKRGYYRRLTNGQRTYYEKLIGQIMEQLSEYEEETNKPLEDSYLLGYYLQKNELYTSKNKEQKDS